MNLSGDEAKLSRMGMRIYVGGLTRYYEGKWHAEERENQKDALQGDTPAIGAAVETWRREFNKKLMNDLKQVLAWDESSSAAHAGEAIGPEWYAALMLLAAYDEHSDATRPTSVPPEWKADPVWNDSVANYFEATYYPHILAAQLWLPNKFEFIAPSAAPSGQQIWIGSSSALIVELRRLAGSAFGYTTTAATPTVASSDTDTPFDRAAKMGLAAYQKMAELSVRQRLPMKLDW